MKQFRLTIILLVVFAALGAYVWFFERGEVSGPSAWKLDPARIRRIELTAAGTTTVVERQGNSWRIVRPISARVARDRMKQLLDLVARIEMRRGIEGAENLKDYGLAKPGAGIKVVLASGEARELELGDRTPDGSAVYAAQKVAAKGRPARPKVFLADTALLDEAIGGAAALRDRTALPFKRADVARLILKRPEGSLVLEKRRKQWEIVTPVAAAADGIAVDDLLVSLGRLEASRFAAESAADLGRYGLGAPRLVIEVAPSGAGKARSLAFGAETGAGEYYAQNSLEPAIMAVPKSAFDGVNKALAQLRSKQIAAIAVEEVQRVAIARGNQRFELRREGEKRWMITAPRRIEADAQTVQDLLWELSDMRAQGFVDSPGALPTYGLAPPQAAVTIYHTHGRQPVRIWLGGAAPSNRIYVKAEGATLYEVPAEVLTRLPMSWVALRNLTLLSYEPGEINRVRAVYDGKTLALERKDTTWWLTEPRKRRANAERMQQLLSLIENARAERYLADVAEPGLPQRVGWDKGTLRLTVETAGQAPKTLGVWKSDGETRLKLDGGDAVFLAPADFLNRLTDALSAVARDK